MVEVDFWGAHRGYKIRFRTIDDTVSDDNGPPRSVTKMSVCGQSTMVVINETHQALDASANDIDASPFVSTTPSDDKIAS